MLEIMPSSAGGIGSACRVVLLASLVAVNGCVLSRSPDLPKAEATNLILSSEPFPGDAILCGGSAAGFSIRRLKVTLPVMVKWRAAVVRG